MVDVVVVGAGPAGLTAALYTARRQLRTLIISKDLGGQAATTTAIENYPGVGLIDGFVLMQRFKTQAEQFGAKFCFGEVSSIQSQADHTFRVTYNNETVVTRSSILAFGLTPRSLDVPGEQALAGHGVLYSTAGVMDQFRGQSVAVVGGGNSALEAMNALAPIARQVYLIHRRNQFRAEAVLTRSLQQYRNVELVLPARVSHIHGTDHVTGVTVTNVVTNQTRELAVDGVIIHIGFMSRLNFVQSLVELNEHNEIVIQADGRTNTPGIFAAGDITTSHYKQVVVSAGDGCKAALACYAYVMQQRGQAVVSSQDWEVTTGQHFIRT